MTKLFFTFGRMQPPTVGHEKVFSEMKKLAGDNPTRIYLSKTHDEKKNPIKYEDKMRFAKMVFGESLTESASNNIVEILKEIETEGFNEICMIVGADRQLRFETLLNKYNGTDYNFDKITVLSVGERSETGNDITSISGTKMRKAAINNNIATFTMGLPDTLKKHSHDILRLIRNKRGKISKK